MTTGPNTEEGKAVVAANGIKHGLRSEKIVLPEVESIEEWEEFRDSILESLQPVGGLEDELANRVAQLSWRLRRGLRAEHDAVVHSHRLGKSPGAHAINAVAEKLLERIEPLPPALAEIMRLREEQAAETVPSLPCQVMLDKIMRYERQCTRQMFQTLHALQALQDRRNGKPSPLVRLQWH